MVTTRNRERANSSSKANVKTSAPAVASDKHEIEKDADSASRDAKRAKQSDDTARQMTLEETLGKRNSSLPTADEQAEQVGDEAEVEMKGFEEDNTNTPNQTQELTKGEEEAMVEKAEEVEKKEVEKVEKAEKTEDAGNVEGAEKTQEVKEIKKTEETGEVKEAEEVEKAEQQRHREKQTTTITTSELSGSETAELPQKTTKVPSTIMEKGIIYFFFRGRVNTERTEEVDDIARSYIMLRPVGTASKLGDGPIGDAGNTRLLAVPKKVLPESGKDRFMTFVEKSGSSFKELREQFLSGEENQTKAGTSHSPAATPAGEGVYVMTTTGRETHLAYMLTLPSDLGEVQQELGIKEQGSFILSTKNPYKTSPANAKLAEAPDFPESILEQFRNLRWMPTKPEHLDYANTQMLMIGESSGIEKAVEPRKQDIKAGKDDPEEVLQEMEDDDTRRMEHLSGDDSASIFADLQARAKDYQQLQTTF